MDQLKVTELFTKILKHGKNSFIKIYVLSLLSVETKFLFVIDVYAFTVCNKCNMYVIKIALIHPGSVFFLAKQVKTTFKQCTTLRISLLRQIRRFRKYTFFVWRLKTTF
jgi:hypothetical protein